MGVMACSRSGCENVMCDRYNSEHGYLCWDCFDELVGLGFTVNVEAFMQQRPNREAKAAVEAYFNELFPKRDTSG